MDRNLIKSNSVILVACMAVMCTQAGMMMYAPSIPFLSKALNASYTEVAFTFTIYVLGYGLAMLLFGGISDQLGRKKSYIATTIIFIATSILLALTQSIYSFIALRFLQGIGGGGCAVIGRSSVRDVCEGKNVICLPISARQTDQYWYSRGYNTKPGTRPFW